MISLGRQNRMLVECLPPRARKDFDFWSDLIGPLLVNPPEHLGKALISIATNTGVTLKTARNRYYAAKKQGVMGLIDRRLCGPKFWAACQRNELPKVSHCESLIQLWKKLCEESNRSNATAYENLKAMWKNRDPQIGNIPEYQDFPGWPRLPRGWSYENFSLHTPSKFELTAARHDLFHAKKYRPTVLSTRKGGYVASHYLYDDQWHDLFVNSFAENQAGRPLEIYSHDWFSARKMRSAIRIRTKTDDDSYKGVAKEMTACVIAATLFQDGYSPRGTVNVAEHGTAGITERIESLLYDMSDGLITVDRSGMQKGEAHLGQYPILGKGNPNHKAPLESSNNHQRNRLDFLPGQTGLSRDRRPAELHGRLAYNALLLGERVKLPPEKAELLKLPLLELNQFMEIAAACWEAIGDERDHELTTWIEAGNVTQLLEFGGQLIPMEQLNEEQRASLPALIEAGMVIAHPARMTRNEVYRAGRGDLISIPGWGVCSILGDTYAKEIPLNNGKLIVRDQVISPSPLVYQPIVRDVDGRQVILREGEKYLGFVNPFAIDTLFVRDAKGAYIGESKRVIPVARHDHEAAKRMMGEMTALESALLKPMRERHADKGQERAEASRNNYEIVRAGAGVNVPVPKPQKPNERRKNRDRMGVLAAQSSQSMAALEKFS
ncbi:MAG: hypothetical protein LBV12_08800 [Puniceicoccales bacterium]|nr:hypothetical protein [Puniceicoccales bacterium]